MTKIATTETSRKQLAESIKLMSQASMLRSEMASREEGTPDDFLSLLDWFSKYIMSKSLTDSDYISERDLFISMLSKSIATWKNNPEKVLEQPIELKTITKNATSSSSHVVSKPSFSCSSSSSSSSSLLPPETDRKFWQLLPEDRRRTDIAMSKIISDYHSGYQHTVYFELGYVSVTNHDMKSLCESSWVIGYVIDAFLECLVILGLVLPGYKFLKMPASYLITAQSDPDGINAHSVAYATRFFTRDSVDGADILIPAHRPGHWFEVVISPSKASVFIIDHLNRDDNYYDLYAWVLNWYAHLLSRFNMVVPHLFKVLQRDLRPLSMNQTDGNSCGVFQSMNFCYLMQTGKLPSAVDFTNADAPMLRRYMQYCIVCVRENMLLATIDLTEEDDI